MVKRLLNPEFLLFESGFLDCKPKKHKLGNSPYGRTQAGGGQRAGLGDRQESRQHPGARKQYPKVRMQLQPSVFSLFV